MGYEMTLRTSETQSAKRDDYLQTDVSLNPGNSGAAVKTALDEFAAGLDGKRPEPLVVEMAARIANAALDKTREPEISVDVDGALSFDLELPDGRLLLAELAIAAMDALQHQSAQATRTAIEAQKLTAALTLGSMTPHWSRSS